MRCLNKNEIIAYADGKIDDHLQLEQIKSHIENCRKCQNLLRTYIVLHQGESNKNQEQKEDYISEISDELHDIMEHFDQDESASKLVKRVKILGVVFTAFVILSIFCIFLCQTFHRQAPSKIFNIADLNYIALGDIGSFDNLQAQEISSAIIFSDIDDHFGVLTSDLAKILSKNKINEEFWKSLSDNLAKQGINMPQSPKILMIEKSLYSYIKSGKTPSDNEIWITFFEDSVILIRYADSNQ